MQSSHATRHEIGARKPFLAFVAFSLLVMAVGDFVFEHYKSSIKNDKQSELGGIAELKITQIRNWLAERRGDGHVLRDDPFFVDAVSSWLSRGGPNDAVKARLIGRLAALQQSDETYGDTSIALVDDQARLRLSSSADETEIGDGEKALLQQSMRKGKAVFSELHLENSGANQHAEIELAVPLTINEKKTARSIGALLFHIDPARFLFPLIQRWPTPSLSAETILVRREGDDVIYLNQLRHERNAPLVMRMPLSQQHLLSSRRLASGEGVAEGMDYRGVPVVAVVNRVAGTSWIMVSKVDRAEIYAQIDRLGRWMLALMLLVIATGCAIVVFWWKKEKMQYESRLEYQRLVKHRDYLVKYANDIFLLLDASGNIVDFNDRALEALGYDAHEFSKMNIDTLRATTFSLPVAERYKQIEQAGGTLTFESMLVRRDGTIFPIEASVRQIRVDQKVFMQGILRDITERKRAEDELIRQKIFFRQVIDSDPDYIFVKDADGRFMLANEAFAKNYGHTTDEIVGKTSSDLIFDAEQIAAYESANREVLEMRRELVSIENAVTVDGENCWFQTTRKPLEMGGGKLCVLTIAVDITQLKLTEIKLAVSYRKLQRLSLHLESIRLDERAKIALSLHDEMGATLAAIKMGVSWMASMLPPDRYDLMVEAASLNALTSDGVRILNRIVTELRPNLLADLGLAEAIRDYISRFRQHTDIECTLDLPADEFVLDAKQSMTVFRILQEALNNVMKHAQAGAVRVHLRQRHGSLLMLVNDDGVGFDTSQRRERSFGLLGIRERALMVGGRARISSAQGRGVSVWVRIPSRLMNELY